jgi:hypothetical protein
MKKHLKKMLGMLGIISLTAVTGCAGRHHLLAKGDVLVRDARKCQIIGTRYKVRRFLKFFVKAEAYYVLDCRGARSHTLESITQKELLELNKETSQKNLTTLGASDDQDNIEPREFDGSITVE